MIFGLHLLPAFALMLAPGVVQSGPICSAKASNLTMPAPVRSATCSPVCDLTTQYNTSLMYGSGSSCAAALSDLTAKIDAYANGQCASITGFIACKITVEHPAACSMDAPGLYSQIGYGYFHCKDVLSC